MWKNKARQDFRDAIILVHFQRQTCRNSQAIGLFSLFYYERVRAISESRFWPEGLERWDDIGKDQNKTF